MAASGSRKQMKESRGGGSDGQTCSLPNGIRTGPVTNDVVADSRDQPNKRAHSTNAGTVTTTHGLAHEDSMKRAGWPVPSTCEAAQPPRPLTRDRCMAQSPRVCWRCVALFLGVLGCLISLARAADVTSARVAVYFSPSGGTTD